MWIWFIILFALSWIPYGMAASANIKPSQADEQDNMILRGLLIIDAVLTIGSLVCLILWISWWGLLFIGLLIGIAFILKGLNYDPYEAIKND